MNTVISVENVSKRYVLQTYQMSLRHEASQIFQRFLRSRIQKQADNKPFWSLRNVSFSLERGDSLGIIGRNGAGKTTLLRVLSGIVLPTEGKVSVNGRFATLIGLGAGFDRERTGRENIFLNAAIQGVMPREMEKVIDDVIAFTELKDFIDRPVKLYSNGMIARLGFSIAFYTLPDIVFLDEILSVGDLDFQAKSFEKIRELKQLRKTLVFVSHNMNAISDLCERVIWLEHGEMEMIGPAAEVIEAYQASSPAH
jgi:ABC-type polysaccharide/polyol phosphate transport system ATPase subunit